MQEECVPGASEMASGQACIKKERQNFNGLAEIRPKPNHRSGDDVLKMLKDLKVTFGKGPGS